jgi:hypothetical protein
MQTLYILEDEVTKLLKVGRAGNIVQRLKNLSTANPRLNLIHSLEVEHSSELEKYIHNRLAIFRREGEFFEVNVEIIIQEINNALKIFENKPQTEIVDQIATLQLLKPPRSVKQIEEELFSELLKVRAELEKLSLHETVLVDQIKVAIGECSGIKNWATYKLFKRNKINLDLMKIECPEIIEKYSITTSTRTLRIRRFIKQNEES